MFCRSEAVKVTQCTFNIITSTFRKLQSKTANSRHCGDFIRIYGSRQVKLADDEYGDGGGEGEGGGDGEKGGGRRGGVGRVGEGGRGGVERGGIVREKEEEKE